VKARFTRRCPVCGTIYREELRFCPRCGARLVEREEA
jgi:rRNA maturation endonuclease Nob1